MSIFIGGYKASKGKKYHFAKIRIGGCFSIPLNPYLYFRTKKDEHGNNAEECDGRHCTYIPLEAEVKYYSKIEEV